MKKKNWICKMFRRKNLVATDFHYGYSIYFHKVFDPHQQDLMTNRICVCAHMYMHTHWDLFLEMGWDPCHPQHLVCEVGREVLPRWLDIGTLEARETTNRRPPLPDGKKVSGPLPREFIFLLQSGELR